MPDKTTLVFTAAIPTEAVSPSITTVVVALSSRPSPIVNAIEVPLNSTVVAVGLTVQSTEVEPVTVAVVVVPPISMCVDASPITQSVVTPSRPISTMEFSVTTSPTVVPSTLSVVLVAAKVTSVDVASGEDTVQVVVRPSTVTPVPVSANSVSLVVPPAVVVVVVPGTEVTVTSPSCCLANRSQFSGENAAAAAYEGKRPKVNDFGTFMAK